MPGLNTPELSRKGARIPKVTAQQMAGVVHPRIGVYYESLISDNGAQQYDTTSQRHSEHHH